MARPGNGYEPKKIALAQLAFDLFLQQGYENTTVTQIMKAVGLTKAGMYHYFSSKEQILDAAIDYGMAKAIEETRAEMAGLDVRGKILRFTRGSSTPNGLMQKFRQYRRAHPDSYASYRIREKGIHAYVPLLEEIFREGMAQGIYHIDYPRQAAEFMVLLVRATSEDNLLPAASAEDEALRQKALVQLMAAWFHLDDEMLAEFGAMFDEDLERIWKEREAYGTDSDETDET